ncbi:MAG: glucose-1-phosphate adenylyltransferase [Candidatus Gastranaerophilales bacterium]|nr:glucose-1-phosphate adenylyltransferase [Candidatus Gastranaerophilales bacterium]
MYFEKVLTMILAGGQGKRLFPLTRDRAKPAVPFGGRYRIIDFVLNNFVNSGLYRIKVLTQYKSDSLNKHISRGWDLSSSIDQYVDLVPAQMRTDGNWYKGTADAIYQNINQITDDKYQTVCVFGGDHVYKMDVRQMLDYHHKKNSDITISAIPVPIELAGEYGVIEVDDNWRLTGFIEKPETKPKSMPNDPSRCLVSMGNYIFKADSLVKELKEDSLDLNSEHDFGKNIIPNMLKNGSRVYIYDFSTNTFPGMTPSEQGYWRDVGNIDSYFQANMDLLEYNPELNLYSKEWPLRTYNYNFPPAKFIWDEDKRVGVAKNSLVSEGCIISGGSLSNCVLSPKVHINSYCAISNSILLENVSIGRYSKINRAIIDKNVEIPAGTEIGINKEDDIKRGFYVSKGGITVVPKDSIIG